MKAKSSVNLVVLLIFITSVIISFPLKDKQDKDAQECYAASGMKRFMQDETKARIFIRQDSRCCGFILTSGIDPEIMRGCK